MTNDEIARIYGISAGEWKVLSHPPRVIVGSDDRLIVEFGSLPHSISPSPVEQVANAAAIGLLPDMLNVIDHFTHDWTGEGWSWDDPLDGYDGETVGDAIRRITGALKEHRRT